METIQDKQGKEYKVFNNTCYSKDVNNKLIYVLDRCMNERNTVKLYYGNKKTGEVWPEEMDVMGHIGKSTGNISIPLIVHTLSYGGPYLLDNCILKIVDVKTKRVLYKHSNFVQPIVEITNSDLPEFSHNIVYNGTLHARVDTLRKAKLLKTKLS